MGRFKYEDLSAPAVLTRTAIAAAVGGTISRVTGGKFANGALTSAMAQLFNAENAARGLAANRQKVVDVVMETEVSEHFKRGAAEVLLMNDVTENGIPIVHWQTINHALDVSYAVGKKVQIISGVRPEGHPLYRPTSRHTGHGAIDVYIAGFTSEQTANALFASGHFRRVSSYTDKNTAHADYMPVEVDKHPVRIRYIHWDAESRKTVKIK